MNKQHTMGRSNKQILYPPRILTSGKIVGDQAIWREVKVRKEVTTTKESNSPIKHQVSASKEGANISNTFDLLNTEEEKHDEEGSKGREEVDTSSSTNMVVLDRSQQQMRNLQNEGRVSTDVMESWEEDMLIKSGSKSSKDKDRLIISDQMIIGGGTQQSRSIGEAGLDQQPV
ncbi:hypothetical protein HAX54_043328 [Datura stramonium]|uniref:Uncharacterized protein n=1 Tax=Datura stramonium TaxID=4076 RepID=A0ABS8W560_DATST|nr:hypothetical protein [Datura stramonium]